jgi:hypothetical protein
MTTTLTIEEATAILAAATEAATAAESAWEAAKAAHRNNPTPATKANGKAAVRSYRDARNARDAAFENVHALDLAASHEGELVESVSEDGQRVLRFYFADGGE